MRGSPALAGFALEVGDRLRHERQPGLTDRLVLGLLRVGPPVVLGDLALALVGQQALESLAYRGGTTLEAARGDRA